MVIQLPGSFRCSCPMIGIACSTSESRAQHTIGRVFAQHGLEQTNHSVSVASKDGGGEDPQHLLVCAWQRRPAHHALDFQ